MMRRIVVAVGGSLMLVGCGGGSSGASSGVQVVSAAPTAAATATPTPAPTATPNPTPAPSPTPVTSTTSSYPRYADLTGDRTFQTACASLVLGAALPTPQPALPFGEALSLGYAADTSGWTVTGDGVSLSFGAGDAVAAASGQKTYEHVIAGSTQRLTLTEPVASGTTLSYTRTLGLRADRSAGTTLYSCAFGVPAIAADVPTAATSYGKIAVAGSAYLLDQNGAVQSYVLSSSTGTMSYDPTADAMVVTVRLVGNLQTASGTASATTDLGTFTSTAAVTAARARFAGQFDSDNGVSLFSSLSGAFFGDTEAGLAFEVLAANTTNGTRVAAVGTLAASR